MRRQTWTSWVVRRTTQVVASGAVIGLGLMTLASPSTSDAADIGGAAPYTMGAGPPMDPALMAANPLSPVVISAASMPGVASAWGADYEGQLGDGLEGGEYNSAVPVEVRGLTGVKAVAGGYQYGMALLENGTVAAWGANSFGQLGNGTTKGSDVPVTVCAVGEKAPCTQPLTGVKAIASGQFSPLALLENGTVVAWGTRLGNGNENAESDVPVVVNNLSGVTAVSSGEDESMVLLENGTVMGWGRGELGNGTSGASAVPVPVCAVGETAPCAKDLDEVTAISAGEFFSLALLANGSVVAWGDAEHGRLGNGSVETKKAPVPVCAAGETAPCANQLSGVKAIDAGEAHSLAVLDNGTAVAWGFGLSGQIGNGEEKTATTPVAVCAPGEKAPCSHLLSEVTAVAAGLQDSFAVLAGGGAVAWGSNLVGELGNPSQSGDTPVPIPVKGLSGATAISTGYEFAFAVGAPPEAIPEVTKVEPAYGPAAGGTSVTITGINLGAAEAVKFGSSTAASFRVESESKIVAASPPGSGTVDVTVTTPVGTSQTGQADHFSYNPSVTRVTPNRGLPSGGTSVTITGTDFNEVKAVKFGSANATSFSVESPSTITAVSPAGSGTVRVSVSSAGGESAAREGDTFTYTAVPGITAVEPDHGPPSGGTAVTIRGTSFTGATAVRFGSNNAVSFKVESENKITAVAPPFSGGSQDAVFVFVTTPGGTNEADEVGSTKQVGFIYEPTIKSIEPNHGPASGGTSVKILGEAFDGIIQYAPPLETLLEPVTQFVYFGETPAKSVNIVSPTEIVAVAPHGSETTNVAIRSVVGRSPTGPATLFSFAPSVTSVTPAGGPALGGTSVDITGTNFNEVTAVRFGSANATSYKVETEDRISAVAPPGSGTVAVTVESAGGANPAGSGDMFAYESGLAAGRPGLFENGKANAGTAAPTAMVGSGQLTLHASALGSEGVECVDLAVGAGWNEAPPTRGLGQILGWSAAGSAPLASRTEPQAGCAAKGQTASFTTDEAPVATETGGSLPLEPQLRTQSTPWNAEVVCGERQEAAAAILRIGVPTSGFPRAVRACPPPESETEQTEVSQERTGKEDCYATNPAPEGCIRITVVDPAAGLEAAYGGTLRGQAINGVKSGLFPSRIRFEGEHYGDLQCEYPVGCSEVASVTGEVAISGFASSQLIQAR